eukprot:16289-Heterococcus_DN1.PRE.7
MNAPLGDLSAIPGPPAVSVQPAGHLYTCSHQQRWPVHSVEAQYVLANNVHICRPVLSEGAARLGLRVAQRTDVVGQSIYPDVHDVSRVAWHRDAPIKAGAGDAQVSQPSFDKAQHFVLAALPVDKHGSSSSSTIDMFVSCCTAMQHSAARAVCRNTMVTPKSNSTPAAQQLADARTCILHVVSYTEPPRPLEVKQAPCLTSDNSKTMLAERRGFMATYESYKGRVTSD